MVDALLPAAALHAALGRGDLRGRSAAVDAAEEGMRATIPLYARKEVARAISANAASGTRTRARHRLFLLAERVAKPFARQLCRITTDRS